MAKNIYGADKMIRKSGVVKSGETILPGDLIIRDEATWKSVGDANTTGAQAVAVTGGLAGTRFVYTDQNYIDVVLTGTVASGSYAYSVAAQSVDGGSQNDLAVGISRGLYPGSTTRCIVTVQTVGARYTKP